MKRKNRTGRVKAPPIIHWYSVNLYATYYQDVSRDRLPRSATKTDGEKIVVSVINDRKSKRNEVYASSDAIIGSRTLDDLFQVMKNQRSTIEHVIIIDRPAEKSVPEPVYTYPQPLVYPPPSSSNYFLRPYYPFFYYRY